MSLQIESSVSLEPLNTLGIPATATSFARITDPAMLPEAEMAATARGIPIVVLGDGSNVVLASDRLNCLLLKMQIPGREVVSQTDRETIVRVGAGENWDRFVAWSVSQNLRGIESLSLVPGTVGAAPVQNVGAYGQEVSQTITQVEAYDRVAGIFVTLANSDCKFGYRDSLFKHAGKHRYIITYVTFRLVPPAKAPAPTYASLQAELEKRGIAEPTVADIREAVIAIRTAKLPDPAKVPTAGSFFHNPIVSAGELHRLETDHPDLPHWPAANGRVKLSAPWLVEQCGFKGLIDDGVGIYEKQALCLINPGHRPADAVLAFRDRIMDAVRQHFGVTLTMEPELISPEVDGLTPPLSHHTH